MSARTPILLAALLIPLFACGCRQEAPQTGSTPEPSTEIKRGTATSPDGLQIAYDVRGEGDITLVFVHCWACNREFWREQVDELSGDYRIVTIDLGGHGASASSREQSSIRGLAGDVEAVANELRLDRMVLVGHSMGGPVCLEASRLMATRVLGVIAVDTLHDAGYEFPAEQAAQMIAAFETDFKGAMEAVFSGLATDTMNDELRSWIVERASAADPDIAIALMRDFQTLNFPELFSGAGVPIRAINAAPSDVIPQTDIEGNRRYADYDATLMEGVGHFLHLEQPAAFNRALRAYVDEIVAAGIKSRRQ